MLFKTPALLVALLLTASCLLEVVQSYDSTELSAFTCYRNAAVSWSQQTATCMRFIRSSINDTLNGGGMWLYFTSRTYDPLNPTSTSCCWQFTYFCSSKIVLGIQGYPKISPTVSASTTLFNSGVWGTAVPATILGNPNVVSTLNGCQLVADTGIWPAIYSNWTLFDTPRPAASATQCSAKVACSSSTCSSAGLIGRRVARTSPPPTPTPTPTTPYTTTTAAPPTPAPTAFVPTHLTSTISGTWLCSQDLNGQTASASIECYNKAMNEDDQRLNAAQA